MYDILVLGLSNSGKSTLVNKLIGKRLNITDNRENTTHDVVIRKFSCKQKIILVADTPGYSNDLSEDILNKYVKNLSNSGLILFIIDGQKAFTNNIFLYVQKLRKCIKNRQIWIIVNKCENQKKIIDNNFFSLKISKKIIMISALYANNFDKLTTNIVNYFDNQSPTQDTAPLLADYHNCIVITGKANAGKSSLFNFFANKQLAKVSPIPHTTRDFLEHWVEFNNTKICLVDTAGFQKVIKRDITSFSAKRSLKIIHQRLNIFYLIDATVELTKTDYQMIHKFSKRANLWIVFTKCDLITHHAITKLKQIIKIDFKSNLIKEIFFISIKQPSTVKHLQKLLGNITSFFNNSGVDKSLVKQNILKYLFLFKNNQFNLQLKFFFLSINKFIILIVIRINPIKYQTDELKNYLQNSLKTLPQFNLFVVKIQYKSN